MLFETGKRIEATSGTFLLHSRRKHARVFFEYKLIFNVLAALKMTTRLQFDFGVFAPFDDETMT